jgi:hypothetical protein
LILVASLTAKPKPGVGRFGNLPFSGQIMENLHATLGDLIPSLAGREEEEEDWAGRRNPNGRKNSRETSFQRLELSWDVCVAKKEPQITVSWPGGVIRADIETNLIIIVDESETLIEERDIEISLNQNDPNNRFESALQSHHFIGSSNVLISDDVSDNSLLRFSSMFLEVKATLHLIPPRPNSEPLIILLIA